MLTIESAHRPAYFDAAGTVITLQVKFTELESEVPFGATPTDPEAHGRDLYARAVAGEFGPVAPYVPPSNDVLAAEVRTKRDALLKDTDWTQLPDVPQETKDLWAPYRQALRDVTEQTGFPADVVWPVPPT